MESPLSVIDAVVIIFTFLSAILAMARGITREVLGIASLVIASLIAAYMADDLSPALSSFIDFQPIASKFNADVDFISAWVTGTLIFVVMWIIFTVLTGKLSRYVNDSVVSGVDSTLGFVFGVIRGLFILGFIYTMYVHFIPPERIHQSVANAQLKPVLDVTSEIVVDIVDVFLPEKMAEGFSKKPQANYDSGDSTDKTINDKELREKLAPKTPEDVLRQLQ